MPAKPVRRRRPAWHQLLDQVLRLAGPDAALAHHTERSWASATFSGTRHVLQLVFAGEAAVAAGEALVAALPDHEFALSGQIVIDATVIELRHRLLPEPRLDCICELLLVEDR